MSLFNKVNKVSILPSVLALSEANVLNTLNTTNGLFSQVFIKADPNPMREWVKISFYFNRDVTVSASKFSIGVTVLR